LLSATWDKNVNYRKWIACPQLRIGAIEFGVISMGIDVTTVGISDLSNQIVYFRQHGPHKE